MWCMIWLLHMLKLAARVLLPWCIVVVGWLCPDAVKQRRHRNAHRPLVVAVSACSANCCTPSVHTAVHHVLLSKRPTLPATAPMYLCRRFLDAQRITSLTRYLEQLHACGLAGADHTTLLLNCYTKLKDVAKLDAFIHRCVSETVK